MKKMIVMYLVSFVAFWGLIVFLVFQIPWHDVFVGLGREVKDIAS